MPSILTNQIKIDNAKTFLDNLTIENSSLYLLLGRPNPWEDESSPPVPADNEVSIAKVWDESIGMKRVFITDVAPVVKRIDWQPFKVYDEYNDKDTELWEKEFYVINKEFDVYKCIDNNKNRQSTVEPTGQSLNIFKTQDNYKWKYIYSISVSDQLKFLTRNWMPVSTNPDVKFVAKPGGIEHIKIISGGTDYSVYSNVVISGDGIGANILPKTRIGVIYDVDIADPGKEYKYASLTVEDESGQYANLIPVISPTLGHGGDTISELGAHYVMINSRTEYNEGDGDLPTDISYRTLSLVKNPTLQDGTISLNRTLNALYSLNYDTSTGSYAKNEIIRGTDSNASAYVVYTESDNISRTGLIKFIQTEDNSNFKDFQVNELLVGETSGTTSYVSSTSNPEVKHDSGRIIYIENRTAVSRFIDQAENIHFVLEF